MGPLLTARETGICARVPARHRSVAHLIAPLLLSAMLMLALAGCSGTEQGPMPALPEVDAEGFLPAIRDQVRTALRKATENPDDAASVGELGKVLHAHEQYAAAEAAYARAERLEEGSAAWPYYLALVRTAQGKTDAAMESIERALSLDADYAPSRQTRAELLIARSRWDEARTELQRILDKQPGDARALYNLGRVQQNEENWKGAAESYAQACDSFGEYGAAHFALANTLRRLGDKGKADQHLRSYELYKGLEPPQDDPLWEKVASLNAGPLTHLRRALYWEAKEDLANAAAANEKALELDSTLVQAHVNLVSLYGRMKKADLAEKHFRAGLQLNPNRDDLYYNYGVLQFQKGNMRGAKIAFERALAINRYHGHAQTNLGYILQSEGHVKTALTLLELAVKNVPNSRLAHFHLARNLIHFQRVDEAIPHLEKTLKPVDEQTPTFLYALAAAHARAGHKQDALRFAREAREMAQDRGQAQLVASINKDISRMEKMPQ